jgi:ribosomal protein L7/L12
MPASQNTTGTRAVIIMLLTMILPVPVLILFAPCASIVFLPILITYFAEPTRLSTTELVGVAWIVVVGAAVVGLIELGIRLYAVLSHRDLRAEREQAQARTARKLEAIRRYREEHGVDLLEAKRAVEAIEQGTLRQETP